MNWAAGGTEEGEAGEGGEFIEELRTRMLIWVEEEEADDDHAGYDDGGEDIGREMVVAFATQSPRPTKLYLTWWALKRAVGVETV